MNIYQARENRTHLMNVTDMLAVAHEAEGQKLILGEPERVIRVSAAYYGGFNTGSDTTSFDRLRGNA